MHKWLLKWMLCIWVQSQFFKHSFWSIVSTSSNHLGWTGTATPPSCSAFILVLPLRPSSFVSTSWLELICPNIPPRCWRCYSSTPQCDLQPTSQNHGEAGWHAANTIKLYCRTPGVGEFPGVGHSFRTEKVFYDPWMITWDGDLGKFTELK